MADPQAALRRWIMEGLKKRGHGAGRELSRRIGVEPEVLSRMKNTDGLKETRRIEAHMIPIIAEFFETVPPGFDRLVNLNCTTPPVSAKNVLVAEGNGEQKNMPDRGKTVTVHIDPPQNSTLVIGDNNTITTHNSQTVMGGAALSAEQALKLDSDVKEVAEAKKTEPAEIWKELCAALDVPDSALITREAYPAAEKILLAWKGRAIRNAVNEGG